MIQLSDNDVGDFYFYVDSLHKKWHQRINAHEIYTNYNIISYIFLEWQDPQI